MKTKIGAEERVATEGEEVVITPGTPHKFWNDSSQDAAFEIQIRPALKMETMLEPGFGLARDGKTNKQGMPNLLQGAVLLQEYSEEMRLTKVPAFVQKLMVPLVAPIGRLFGFKAIYTEYSDER